MTHCWWVIEKYSKLYASDRTTKTLSYLAMFGLVFSATLFFALTQRNRHSNGAGHNLIRQSLFDLEATGICENMNYKLETRMVWKIFFLKLILNVGDGHLVRIPLGEVKRRRPSWIRIPRYFSPGNSGWNSFHLESFTKAWDKWISLAFVKFPKE